MMSCFYYCLREVSLITLSAILRYCDVRTAGSSRCCVRVLHVCGWGSCQWTALSEMGCESVINYRSIWALPIDV